MQIFEYPYVIISIFVICFFVLDGVGIYFAMRGLKTANDEEENDFTNISKLEGRFVKSGRLREKRCVIYISVYLENYRSLYSEAQTERVFNIIRRALLHSFSNKKYGLVSTYGDYTYVAYSTQDEDSVRAMIEDFNASLTKGLIDNNALNIAEVKIGLFFAFGSDVSFDEAINRAKQACILAKNEKINYAEWDVGSGKALEKKIKIENNIESEIDNNRFFLEYQPVLDAKTKEIIGAEVLSRLNSSSDGVLNPGSFLSALDSVGLNNKFDYYIFEKNCKWISNDKKQREGYKYTINFSRSTLCDPTFVEK